MTNTDGTVPGNLPNVSKTYCACAATQALNAGSWIWALPRRRALPVHAPGCPGVERAAGAGPGLGDVGVHQREYLEFPQCADIGTGPLNAHLAPS
jgi:hypothetical protein